MSLKSEGRSFLPEGPVPEIPLKTFKSLLSSAAWTGLGAEGWYFRELTMVVRCEERSGSDSWTSFLLM